MMRSDRVVLVGWSVCIALLMTASARAQGWGEGHHRGRRGIQANAASIGNHSDLLTTHRDQSTISLPNEGPNHRPFHARLLLGAPRRQFMAPMRDAALLRHVAVLNRSEVTPNRYYWHLDGGHRFCHYYDAWGYHWYGWYAGSDFFWTRYYSGRWWWYDSSYDRWCYWHDGGWWWQDPARGLVSAYSNNAYTPADGTVSSANATLSSDPDRASEFWDAADHRAVKMHGRDAFLYDTNDPPSFDPKFLSSKVTDVRFLKAHQGHPLRISVSLEDGSFLLFDGRGRPSK